MLLEIRDLCFSYEDKKALNGITFSADEGEYIALTGPAGSGKSTLLMMLNGLFLPDSGKVLLNGVSPGTKMMPTKEACRYAGLAFQFPETQLFEDTVEHEIAFGPKNLGVSGQQLSQRVTEALEALDLNEALAVMSPFSLSAGEKRRVALAGTVAMQSRLFAFDEPLAGLDPSGRKKFLDMTGNLSAKGHAVIIATHDIDEIVNVASRFIVLEEGQLVFDGPPRQFFNGAIDVDKLHVKKPDAVLIAEALRSLGVPLDVDILDYSELAEAIIELRQADS